MVVAISRRGYHQITISPEPFYGDRFDYYLTLQSSNTEYGPFSNIIGPVADQYVFEVPANTDHRYRFTYYRVIITGPNGYSHTFPQGEAGMTVGVVPTLHALEIANDIAIRLYAINGQPAALCSRRVSGARCVCYDRTTGKIIKSNCKTCYGTSWAGGYHKPVLTFIDFTRDPDQVQLRELGLVNVDTATFLAPSTPRMNTNDMVVDQIGRRWRIGGRISRAEVHQFSTSQSGLMIRIPETDIEYDFPVDRDLLRSNADLKHRLNRNDL